jgi:Secretion system C-terminal sorting domain
MKRLFLLSTLTFLFSFTLIAQIVPNGGFETWTILGSPENWYANNIPTVYTTVTQSSTAHSGSSSVKGTVVSYLTSVAGPVIQSGTSATGFAVSQRYKTVTGYYQFNPLQGDKLGFNFILYNSNNAIAIGAALITASASSWTQFNVDFTYLTNDVPDNCILQILIIGPGTGSDYHVGSYFLVDDLNLTGTNTSVNDKNFIPAKFSLDQNYPNPFNPSTKIKYDLPENSYVSLKVYNIIGKEVASLVNSVVPAGTHEVVFDASGLNSGIYFYTLKTGNNFVQTKKMILMK